MNAHVLKFLRALCWALEYQKDSGVVNFAVFSVAVNLENAIESLEC